MSMLPAKLEQISQDIPKSSRRYQQLASLLDYGIPARAAIKSVLTPKEYRFLELYLEHGQLTKASSELGILVPYGAKILSRPVVSACIRLMASELFKDDAPFHLRELLRNLVDMSNACITDVVEWDTDKDGEISVRVKNSNEIPAGVAKAITEVQLTHGRYGANLKVKMADKNAAMGTLSRILAPMVDATVKPMLPAEVTEDAVVKLSDALRNALDQAYKRAPAEEVQDAEFTEEKSE